MRGGVRADDRGPRSRLLDHPGRMRRGIAASWKGFVGDKVVVELNVRWRKGETLEPDWKIEQEGWVIQIEGRPTVTLNVGLPSAPLLRGRDDRRLHGARAHHDGGATAQRDPAVVAAAPGIATYNDLPLVLPRGLVPLGSARHDAGTAAACVVGDRIDVAGSGRSSIAA